MSPILRIIKAIIDGGLTDAADVAKRLSLQGKPDGETRLEIYKRSLTRLGIVVLILPILIVVVGLIGNLGWLVAIIGIFWSLVTVILLALAAPIGVILEAIIGRSIRGSGARYYKLCLGILLSELAFTLFRAGCAHKQQSCRRADHCHLGHYLRHLGRYGSQHAVNQEYNRHYGDHNFNFLHLLFFPARKF